jgi:hypothetical protein
VVPSLRSRRAADRFPWFELSVHELLLEGTTAPPPHALQLPSVLSARVERRRVPLPMKLKDQQAEAREAIQLRDGFRGSGTRRL